MNSSAYKHPDAICLKWQIPKLQAPVRADLYIKSYIRRLTRHKVKKIIELGNIRVNNQKIKSSDKIFGLEQAELWRIKPDDPSDLEQYTFETLFEDENILALNKPSGIAVHPTSRDLFKTLTYWIKTQYPGNYKNICPCHRLDRETSGVIIFSKNKPTERKLKILFSKNQVSKTYLAIVSGKLENSLENKRIEINYPLGLQGEKGLVAVKMIYDKNNIKNSKPARTYIEPVKYFEKQNKTLVKAFPKTGRQHQIRAHLALIGFPIVADKLYNLGEAFFDKYTKIYNKKLNSKLLSELEQKLELNRHALHAHEIEFELDNKRYYIKSELPEDLENLLD